jgi:four helix bundle protein
MAGIERLEDIDAWKEARRLAQEIYRITRSPAFQEDEALRTQIQRAAVSITSVYAHTTKVKSLIGGFARYLRSTQASGD